MDNPQMADPTTTTTTTQTTAQSIIALNEIKTIESLHRIFLSGGNTMHLNIAIKMAERLVSSEKSVEPLLAKMRGELAETEKEGRGKVGGIAGMLLQRGKPETSNRSPMYAKNACLEESADNVVDLFKQLALMFDTTGDQVYLDGALRVIEGLETVDARIIGDIQRLQLAHKARADLEADLGDIMEGVEQQIAGTIPEDGAESSGQDSSDCGSDFKKEIIRLSSMVSLETISPESALDSVTRLISQDERIRHTLPLLSQGLRLSKLQSIKTYIRSSYTW
ncbi:hypothetical protein DFP73DRAFT_636698 [Morchella snyderi]|nr:hypothetical protein DFP73DRAFT_636698 [Morchella snyderi]